MKHHYDAFPFIQAANVTSYFGDGIVCAILTDSHSSLAEIGPLKDHEITKKAKELVSRSRFPSYEELKHTLGLEFYSFRKFLYCGPTEGDCVCSNHILELVVLWLNEFVAREILDANRERVLDAIPEPPTYNIEEIIRNIFVLEDEIACKQGTCFTLKGIGFVSCQHAISNNLFMFSHREPNRKYKVCVKRQSDVIDLAILDIPDFEIKDSLRIGTSDNLKQMDHVAIAGFPNYRLGDSGSFSPGIITGFRMVSSIRRILVNTPIIGGNSGGPALDKNGNVIGVAITGADRIEDSDKTENHGIVPIEALKFI
jgi:hypothetical protein